MADVTKIDCQGSELDIIKGAIETSKYCKYLVLELQGIDHNKNSLKPQEVIDYLKSIGYLCIADKCSDDGADFDSCSLMQRSVNIIHNKIKCNII